MHIWEEKCKKKLTRTFPLSSMTFSDETERRGKKNNGNCQFPEYFANHQAWGWQHLGPCSVCSKGKNVAYSLAIGKAIPYTQYLLRYVTSVIEDIKHIQEIASSGSKFVIVLTHTVSGSITNLYIVGQRPVDRQIVYMAKQSFETESERLMVEGRPHIRGSMTLPHCATSCLLLLPQ